MLVQITTTPPLAELTLTAEQPWHHIVPGNPTVLLLLEGSRIYAFPEGTALKANELSDLLAETARQPPPVRFERQPSALSLNIAQSCNLACSYCYADEGRFGGEPQMMSLETALAAIRRHISESSAKAVSVGFIGGEPVLNRDVLHRSVQFASREAERKGIEITFGITTNGTLLEESDLKLLRAHRFAVTVSMDGDRETHDQLRTTRRGQPSFAKAIARISPLLTQPGLANIAARVTVTRRNLDVSSHIDALVAIGFSEIGVSPLRTGPDHSLCLRDSDWSSLLSAMILAASHEWERARISKLPLRFSNLAVALKQLHRGSSQTLPCGSAASYVSLSAEGRYYTCHRTVGDPSLELGDLKSGPSVASRRRFVESRHVENQEPCRSCWARYLCGGGCHAEVLQVGRGGCDYIRGWLEYCIALYPQVLTHRPDLLAT